MPTHALWVQQGRNRDVPPPRAPITTRLVHAQDADGNWYVLNIELREVH